MSEVRMARLNDDLHRSSRPRANTFAFPIWRTNRGRQESSPQTSVEPATLSSEALLDALSPPAVPSLNHARTLAVSLTRTSPKPRLSALLPVITALCAAESPLSFQAAGFDIMAAYWGNGDWTELGTADKLSCLSLFLNAPNLWSEDVWEPKYRALIAFTRDGTETVGFEGVLLRILRNWIEGAFADLLEQPANDERCERQRSVEQMASFHLSLVSKQDFVARLSTEDVAGVLQIYGGLMDRSLSHFPSGLASELPSPLSPSAPSPSRHPPRHARISSTTAVIMVPKNPVDLAIELFLNYLDIRLTAIAPDHLKTIVSYLFRALAWYLTPLPRLTLNAGTPQQHPIERRVSEVLDSLVTGPYAASCAVTLKHDLFPNTSDMLKSSQTALGALRTLRTSIRRTLITRLARSYITRESSAAYTLSGAPAGINLEHDLMERAWSRDDVAVWGLPRFRGALCAATKQWINIVSDKAGQFDGAVESILNEIAGVIMDMTHSFEETVDGEDSDEDDVQGVNAILTELVVYVLSRRYVCSIFWTSGAYYGSRTFNGAPITLDLAQGQASTPFLSTLAALLSPHLLNTPLYDALATIKISIAPHVNDADMSQLLVVMMERQSLSPTSPKWLEYWEALLSSTEIYSPRRPLSRDVCFYNLQSVWDFVKDIPQYRRPMASLVYDVWQRYLDANPYEYTSDLPWRILGDEAVLATSGEGIPLSGNESATPDQIVEFLVGIASNSQENESFSAEVYSPVASVPATTVSSPMTLTSPSRLDSASIENAIPSVMSLFSSLATGNSSRSQSQQPRTDPHAIQTETLDSHTQDGTSIHRAVGAVISLISIFSQCTFTSWALSDVHRSLAIRVFNILVTLCSTSPSTKARICALQFLMRLRVDRDHRLYYVSSNYDENDNISSLGAQIQRGSSLPRSSDVHYPEESEVRQARPRFPQERNGRRQSRGPGRPSTQEANRSRSRAPSTRIGISPSSKLPYETLWSIPESIPFAVTAEADTPSEGLSSYDPTSSEVKVVLPLSSYLAKLKDLLMSEKDWEVLSYVLCHLPTQLANKHLFCGPKSKLVIANLLASLCGSIVEGRLGSTVIRWPDGVLPRDAQGLAYHTLIILVSYKQCFKEPQLQHRLVEAFLSGLNGPSSTIKTCLHGLSLSAFELQPSMTKHLSRILEKLSQIMSNPAMAVHIIDFLSIVGSLPILHANFTDGDYKMVFGVALQYLQHHNRSDGSVGISWALSQHVRIMSYYIVYLWFLAVKLPDRPRHIKYITRQLLLANDGKDDIDEPAEVCFDWLARYTYASADPRPASSMLSEMITDEKASRPASDSSLAEKTWIYGNSVVTIRTLARRGWIEVLSRRASGLTKFLCRAENLPLVTPGDVDPDITSLSVGLVLERAANSEAEDKDARKEVSTRSILQ